jgi:hypothetical protein
MNLVQGLVSATQHGGLSAVRTLEQAGGGESGARASKGMAIRFVEHRTRELRFISAKRTK